MVQDEEFRVRLLEKSLRDDKNFLTEFLLQNSEPCPSVFALLTKNLAEISNQKWIVLMRNSKWFKQMKMTNDVLNRITESVEVREDMELLGEIINRICDQNYLLHGFFKILAKGEEDYLFYSLDYLKSKLSPKEFGNVGQQIVQMFIHSNATEYLH